MTSKLKAVIFDMDGVIVDSEPIHSRSLELLALQYNAIPIYYKNGLMHKVGLSNDKSSIAFMKKHNINDSLESFRQKRRKIFADLLQQKLSPMPGILKLIRVVKSNNFKIGLASNRFLEHVSIIINNLNIEKYFDTVVTKNDKLAVKPAPDIYLKTAQDLHVNPTLCIAIEDSETGIISAKRAHMKVIAVPNRYTQDQDLSKADRVFKSLSDITIKVLNNL